MWSMYCPVCIRLKMLLQDGSRKPEVINIYNLTKFGIHQIDQMCCVYSTKGGGHGWPVHVFSNMLGIADINAHAVFN